MNRKYGLKNVTDQAPAKLGQFQGVVPKNPTGIGKNGVFFLIKK